MSLSIVTIPDYYLAEFHKAKLHKFRKIQYLSDSTKLRSAFLAQTIRALHAVAEKYNPRELTGILREHPTNQWS